MKKKMVDILKKSNIYFTVKKHCRDYAICFDDVPVMCIDKPDNIVETQPKQSIHFINNLLRDSISESRVLAYKEKLLLGEQK